MKKQFWRFTLVLTLALASFLVVSAQIRPVMTVYAVWTPDEQLTSVSVPTLDERFVDLQIYAQGNVPFWAVNLTCTVGSINSLDLVSLTFPQEWGTLNTDYYYSPQTPSELYTGLGVLSFTATRLGATNTQLGLNGQDFTQLLATARFKVKDLSANTRASVSCSMMEFIDRNGNVAIRARQTRFNDLQIYVGYTLTGTALRQGTRLHQNIEVSCGLLGQPLTNQTVFTTTNGSFRFGGSLYSSTALRHFGLYRCTFISEYVQNSPNNQILQSYVDFELNTATRNLMPILLRAGDSNNDSIINFADITSIASGNGAIVPAFTGNDMNGDGRTDRLDLVLTASNFGLGDTNPGFLNDHIIYSIGRDLDPRFTYPNSRIYLGSTQSADISIINSRGRTRDFWAQLSPDGTEIVHISQDTRTGLHQLAIMSVSNGASRIVRFPRGFNDHAFAPSWSPDGNRIAFICTPDNTTGFRYNRGDICIMNSADRAGSAINRLGVQSRIFPPTWLPYEDGFVLLYGGVDGDIHYYDFVSSSHGVLAVGDAASADVLDMPVVVNYAYNDTAYLAYRFNDNDATFDPYLRIGSIDFDGTSFSGEALDIIDADHVSLSATTTGLDYFDVSPTIPSPFMVN